MIESIAKKVAESIVEAANSRGDAGLFKQGVVSVVNADLSVDIDIDSGSVSSIVFLNCVPSVGDTVWVVNLGSGRWLGIGIQGVAAIPPGTIVPYAGTAAQPGYLAANGQAVSRTTFAALFAVCGTTFGVGNGSTTFNVPDLRGRVAIGLDNMLGASDAGRVGMANTLGAGGGSHTHSTTGASTGGTSGGVSAWHTHKYSAGNLFEADTLNPSSNHTHYTSVNYTAPSTATDVNLPPYLLLNYLIKT